MDLHCVLPNFVLTTQWRLFSDTFRNPGGDKKKAQGEGHIHLARNLEDARLENRINMNPGIQGITFKIRDANIPLFYTVSTQVGRSGLSCSPSQAVSLSAQSLCDALRTHRQLVHCRQHTAEISNSKY